MMLPHNEEILALIDQAIENKYLRVETIRRLAGTEESYRVIIREVDRVKAQRMYARSCNAPATLTVIEWFALLDSFHWKCAYCRQKPFQSMSHIIPQKEGGTTVKNCVPACHSCVSRPNKPKVLSLE